MSQLRQEAEGIADEIAQLREDIAAGLSPRSSPRLKTKSNRIRAVLSETEKREQEIFAALGIPYKQRRKTVVRSQPWLIHRGILEWLWTILIAVVVIVAAFPAMRYRAIDLLSGALDDSRACLNTKGYAGCLEYGTGVVLEAIQGRIDSIGRRFGSAEADL